MFAFKEALVTGYPERRDKRWCGDLAAHVEAFPGASGAGRVRLAAPVVRRAGIPGHHVDELRIYVRGLADIEELAEQLLVLVEGSIALAAVRNDPPVAWPAKAAAKALISG